MVIELKSKNLQCKSIYDMELHQNFAHYYIMTTWYYVTYDIKFKMIISFPLFLDSTLINKYLPNSEEIKKQRKKKA